MLTDRQLLILQVIIDDFISSAQPVGSRAISKKEEITFSSATIRNEMADLEEHGYIEKTHSSSGRIPSEKGYRYYVDHLLSPWSITKEDIMIVKSLFAGKVYELEKIIQKSAQILSMLTNYTAIALGPTVAENRLKRIQIVPINKEKAVAIIVTDKGHVENHMISIPASIEPTDIEKMVNILNDKLIGVPLVELQDKIYKEVAILLKAHIRNYDLIINDITNLFEKETHEKVYFSGKINMLSQPEFNDVSRIKSLLSLIDKEQEFYNIIRNNQKSKTGINVRIGRENKMSEMENCSLITTSFSIGSESLGTIAILGPTRMDYSRVISLMKFISSDLSDILTNMYENN